MDTLSCKCGCSDFNIKTGIIRPWALHVLTCRQCGDKYSLPRIWSNDVNVSYANGGGVQPNSYKKKDD